MQNFDQIGPGFFLPICVKYHSSGSAIISCFFGCSTEVVLPHVGVSVGHLPYDNADPYSTTLPMHSTVSTPGIDSLVTGIQRPRTNQMNVREFMEG